ncbi:hypothetical protein BDV32DRAFT_147175 [Aspergillus pseudonomiae]|uniref:Uncharacterized protein n=1 Tax=Aspergillus pseudonomiae TaxID=1506151 RepID=A0A5N6I9C2_9EURO|nr:uncharacterized protein BDV37DRAFT_277887 [Aspergillus pseudonomiae]KAB8262627.1 hypothetical protein BDV32DRAFT_147175 [Aspergillus pseudonomiae]KAE8409545.1 hypothetical protein BDV37DRAFT_277887 [Aspergillus pseudonomiae]
MGSFITSDQSNQGNPKDGIPWYLDTLERVPPLAQRVLEEYAGLKPEEVKEHVLKIREKAWTSSPYPCVGLFRFLDFSLPDSPLYREVLDRVKYGEKLLDFGCCFGHDIRALIADGAPAENLYAAELNATFLDLGFELFRDRDTIKSTFYTANIFDENDKLRAERLDSFEIIHTGSFLHLFSWDGQKKAALALLKLLKRQKGSLIVGRQHGSTTAKEVQNYLYKPTKENEANGRLATFFNHDAESFQRLWDEIGEETGLKFEVRTEWGTWGSANGMDPAYYNLWSWEDKETLRFKFWVRVV